VEALAVLKTILTVSFIIICIALTVVVLMQEGKQQGLGSIGGMADSYWGKNKGRSMEGILVKATTVMVVLFMVISAVLSIGSFK
jgi:preprotein translocase subunit SecG